MQAREIEPVGTVVNAVPQQTKAAPVEEEEEAGSVAAAGEPERRSETEEAPDADDMVWPEGAVARETPVAEPPASATIEDAPLPKLDELTKRIPPQVLETLDELFRARFVAVRRTPAKSLKSV